MKSFFVLIILLSSIGFSQFTKTVVSLSGATKDAINEQEIKAKIKVLDKQGKTVNRTNSQGHYFLTGLQPGMTYDLEISATGYFTKLIEYTVPDTKKYEEFSRDFVLQSMEIGSKIPVKVIPFDRNKSKLRTGADYIFSDLIAVMKKNRRAKFVIQVYPEGDSNPAEDKALAEQRANAIKEFLQSHQVRTELVVDAQSSVDPNNPPPSGKTAKGKRYKGSIYLVLQDLGATKH